MSVLCVIPCLNEEVHLPGLLNQLLRDATVTMIVVADGGSTDRSQEITKAFAARSKRICLIANPHRIQSVGINMAVDRFGGDYEWLLRVDAHCLYPDAYAETLLAAAISKDADSVVVPMITVGRAGFQLAVATAQNSPIGTGGSAHRHLTSGRFVDHGHHALMRIQSFRDAGGYCEAMACNEDAELDHRIGLGEGRIWLEPSGAIKYFPRTTPRSLWRQYFKYGSGRARNVVRHRMSMKIRQLIPVAVSISVAMLALLWVTPLLAVPASVWLITVLSVGALIGAYKGGGWRFLTGFAAAIMHLAWGTGFIWELVRNPRGVPFQRRFERVEHTGLT